MSSDNSQPPFGSNLLEQTEFTLYQVYEELKEYLAKVSDQRRCELVMMLGSVTDTAKISSILQAQCHDDLSRSCL